MKKFLALTLALIMVLSLFAGCGSKEVSTDEPAKETQTTETPKTEAPADSDEDIVITFLGAMYSDKTEPYLKSVCEAFEAQNPGIKINLEIVGWDNISTRAAALIGAGQAPDIYNGGSASEYVPDGLLYNVNDICSEELLADFYPQFLENNTDINDGQIYALPYLASVRALYCNKAIFDEVGITEAPTTWTEVEAACEKIDAYYNGEVYSWGIDATTTEGQTMMAYYGWSNGGGFVDEDYNYIFNCDANVEGYEWAYSLYENGWTNQNPSLETRDDMQKLVVEGKMAMLVTACFFPSLYPETELIVGTIPYNDANVSSSSTLGVQDGLMIFNGTATGKEDTPERKAAISKFLDFFYAPENYTQFMINEGMLPATQAATELLVEQNPDQAAYLDVLAGAKFYARNLTSWREAMTTLITYEQEMLAGNMTAKEALDAAQAEVEGLE